MGNDCCNDRTSDSSSRPAKSPATSTPLPMKSTFHYRDISQFRRLAQPITSLYRTISTIEQSSYWRTALVEETATGLKCRLKTVTLGTGQEASARLQATEREIAIIAQLDHPSIGRLKGCLQDDLFLYILSEAGEISLQSHLFSIMSFSEANAAYIMQQIFTLVAYCHSQGIMLRSLSLSSVYLTSKGRLEVKLVDFASACEVGSGGSRPEVLVESLAPETLSGNCGPQCDIWSCGFLLFFLISGDSPYLAMHHSKSLEERIRSGLITYSGRRWSGRSAALTALLNRLLNPSPIPRPSASQCLADPWLLQFPPSSSVPVDLNPALLPLRRFRPGQEWKKALIAFVIRRILPEEQVKARADLFKSLDLNGDGYVSAEELAASLGSILPAEQANSESKQILSCVDANKNGLIDFSEFLTASFDEQTVLSRENRSEVFRCLDLDQDGFVTLQDLKTQFEARDDQEWQKLLGKVGKRLNDRISQIEFDSLLNKRE